MLESDPMIYFSSDNNTVDENVHKKATATIHLNKKAYVYCVGAMKN